MTGVRWRRRGGEAEHHHRHTLHPAGGVVDDGPQAGTGGAGLHLTGTGADRLGRPGWVPPDRGRCRRRGPRRPAARSTAVAPGRAGLAAAKRPASAMSPRSPPSTPPAPSAASAVAPAPAPAPKASVDVSPARADVARSWVGPAATVVSASWRSPPPSTPTPSSTATTTAAADPRPPRGRTSCPAAASAPAAGRDGDRNGRRRGRCGRHRCRPPRHLFMCFRRLPAHSRTRPRRRRWPGPGPTGSPAAPAWPPGRVAVRSQRRFRRHSAQPATWDATSGASPSKWALSVSNVGWTGSVLMLVPLDVPRTAVGSRRDRGRG